MNKSKKHHCPVCNSTRITELIAGWKCDNCGYKNMQNKLKEKK